MSEQTEQAPATRRRSNAGRPVAQPSVTFTATTVPWGTLADDKIDVRHSTVRMTVDADDSASVADVWSDTPAGAPLFAGKIYPTVAGFRAMGLKREPKRIQITVTVLE